MKKILLIIGIVMVMVIGLASVAFAAGIVQTPAEIVAGLTGKSVEEVNAARENGATYGEQAAEAGKLEEFKDERLALLKSRLDEAVANKELTQAEADAIYARMAERMENCTGDGSGCAAGNGGCGLGGGRGMGQGFGRGNGGGCGMGGGRGLGGCVGGN